jgi:hypothetical protein
VTYNDLRSKVLFSVIAACAACKRHDVQDVDAKFDSKADPKIDASILSLMDEEYWLLETPLSASPDGGASKHVAGPALVVLGDDGKVETPVGSYPPVNGYVPQGILKRPEVSRGLMRYAVRTAELHAESPSGPVIGRLHLGAFVSVAPNGVSDADTGFALVGNLGPGRAKPPLVAYVEKAALESTPANVESEKPIPGREARATFGIVSTVWYGGSADAKPLSLLRCHEVLLRNEGAEATQFLEGVELTGRNEYAFLWTASPLVHGSLVCPAHAVTRRGDELVLVEPNPRWDQGDPAGSEVVRRVVPEIPPGYARVAPLERDRLAATIERGGSLYWLVATDKGLRCDTWRFEFVRKRREGEVTTLEARLRHPGPLDHLEEMGSVHYPATYRMASGGKPALLHFDTLTTAAHLAMKCVCEYDYRILSIQGDEVLAVARPFPDDAVAFDPAEAERWFFTKQACDAHRERAVKAIELDGHQTTRVGFHAGELL